MVLQHHGLEMASVMMDLTMLTASMMVEIVVDLQLIQSFVKSVLVKFCLHLLMIMQIQFKTLLVN